MFDRYVEPNRYIPAKIKPESTMLHHKVMDREGFLKAHYVIRARMRISPCTIVRWAEAYLIFLDTSMHLQAPSGSIPERTCHTSPSRLLASVCHILGNARTTPDRIA